MDWGYFLPWLERLQLPVLCLGVGAQAAKKRKMNLSAEHQRIWKIISERTHSIGVRGEYTASVLNDIGIHNVEIVGCPTLFRHRDPHLQLNIKPFADVEKVSFSLRRETSSNYTESVDDFLTLQKKVIRRLAGNFDLMLTAHGESEEKSFYYRDPATIHRATRTLKENGWFDGDDGDMEQMYRSKLFFTTVVSHSDEFMRQMDFTIGYRVHGVLPALAQGVPGVLLNYDARSAELADTLSVPILSPGDAARLPLEEIFCEDQFAAFKANFTRNYNRMKQFLMHNQIADRM